jgi:uncharacterized protein
MRKLRILLLLSLSLSSVAQTVQPTDAPASKDQILKLFDVMDIRKQSRLMMQSMEQQMRTTNVQAMKARYPQITPEQLDRINKISAESMKDFPLDAMLDDMIPIYQKHLTSTDVDAMIAFYSSPTGKKLMQQLPQITQEAMQASNARVQKHMQAVLQHVDEMMKENQPQK